MRTIQQQFRQEARHPQVQALRTFITQRFGRSLEQVHSYGVETRERSVRTFFVRFRDGTRLSGVLRETWVVDVQEVQRPCSR